MNKLHAQDICLSALLFKGQLYIESRLGNFPFSTASPLLFPLPDIIVLVVYRSGFSFEGVGVVGLSERGVLGAWGCLHSFVHVPRDLFFYSLFLGGRT